MAKIESIENIRPAVLNEVVATKRRCTPTTVVGKVLTGVFIVSLIIAVSLLLVGFLMAGLSHSVYLAVLIMAGCVALVSLSALVGALFLRCLLSKGKKEVASLRESVETFSREPSVSSADVSELGVSNRDWKKFDQESQDDIRALLQVAQDLKNDQAAILFDDALLKEFLIEISYINEFNL